MRRNGEPGDLDPRPSPNAPEAEITRRSVLAGIAGTAIANAALAGETDTLDIFFADERHDEVVIAHRGAEHRWTCQMFGETARFKLARASEKTRPGPGHLWTWQTRGWTLLVENASFPDISSTRSFHSLTFKFGRDQPVAGAEVGPWSVELETIGWPSGRAPQRFGSRAAAGLRPVPLINFLNGRDAGGSPACLEALVPEKTGQAMLVGFFRKRIQSSGPLVLGLDKSLAWYVQSPAREPSHAGNMWMLEFPLQFTTLKIERTFDEDDSRMMAARPGASSELDPRPQPDPAGAGAAEVPAAKPKNRRLFADETPRARPGDDKGKRKAGLYAEAGGPFELPRSSVCPGEAFEFAFAGQGDDRVGATLSIGDRRSLRAAFRHWGLPDETVAGMEIGGGRDDCRSVKTLARLMITTGSPDSLGTPAATFDLAAVVITRGQRPEPRKETAFGTPAPTKPVVETRAWLTPSEKEHRILTPLGPLDVRAAPAIPPGTGSAARIPPITLRAEDIKDSDIDPKGSNDSRRLLGFEAVLSLVSAGVWLPERIAGAETAGSQVERSGEHVSRLDFADAECRFILPALGEREESWSADAVVPLGPDPAAKPRDGYLDLGRAKLTVLRPADLLSLSYRFSGLLLELPRSLPPGARRPARIMPSRGGPVCRAASRPGTGESPAHPARDERPILVAEFPPQHVAERAYLRQIPSIELPLLPESELKESQDKAWLAKLREPKPRRGKDPGGVQRKARVAAREQLDGRIVTILDAIIAKRGTSAEVVAAKQAQSHQDLRVAFRAEAEKANLPREQRIYLGPEFLDPDARRIALALLSPKRPVPQDPDVELTRGTTLEILSKFVDSVGANPTLPIDAGTFTKASDALEDEKDRLATPYKVFREKFAQQAFAAGLKPDDKLATYRGRDWFREVRQSAPPSQQPPTALEKLLKWVDKYVQLAGSGADDDYQEITEARLSGPSWLAFRINCDDFQAERIGGGLPFSLEALTDWGSMDLAVVRRAEKLPLPPARGPAPPRWARTFSLDEAEILQFQGIARGDRIAADEDKRLRGERPSEKSSPFRLPASRTSPAARLAQVTEAARRPPDPFQTAIELPFRLFLSPAQDSGWLTPHPSVRRKAFGDKNADLVETCQELWSATLAGSGVEAGLRAVWSPDFRPEALLSIDKDEPGAPPEGPWAPWSLPRRIGARSDPDELAKLKDWSGSRFRTALSASDRHELVALSSLYGLPVLGRRDLNGALLGGSQIDPPSGYRLSGLQYDAPRPDLEGKRDLTPRDYSAIYRPQILSVTELALTALGGNLNLDTTFTPPASARTYRGDTLFDAFSIASWRQRTVLGRDVLVEVVYKGFLFPIGHKATLVKLTERRFEAVTPGGPPVAVLVQRLFLRLGDPDKSFPAYDHPNGGRRWPCQLVTMLTRVTPDLVEAEDQLGGKIDKEQVGKPITGRMFWPRTARAAGAEVQFQMRVDAESAPVSIPLVFVDNTAANDPATMEALVDWYNTRSPTDIPSRRLSRNGQPVRMAPEAKPGDTSFETEWWDLKAEGRELKPLPSIEQAPAVPSVRLNNRRFERDPFMEGLDQPAFYPFCDAARCRLKQVERFTGTANASAVVAFDGYYVAQGFGEPAQDGEIAPANEIFLRLIKYKFGDPNAEPIRMRMGSGERSGGVGQPNLNIVGLSRATGPVGRADYIRDSKREDPVEKPVPLDEPAGDAGDGQARTQEIASLSAHTAEPKAESLFPADAKLLGLVPLSEILKIAVTTGKRALLKDQPQLKEVYEYGASAAQGIGAEARAFISQNVLQPVETLIGEVRATWTEIARRDLALPAGDAFSLEKAYPQIGTGLKRLDKGVQAALAPTTSDAAFFPLLADIYEAGRALIGALDRILRDPLASISETQLAKIRDVAQKISTIAEAVPEQLAALKKDVADNLRSKLVDLLTAETTAAWRRALFALPLPTQVLKDDERKELADAVDKALRDELRKALANGFELSELPDRLGRALRNATTPTQDVKDALTQIADRMKDEVQGRLTAIATPYLLRLLPAVVETLKAVEQAEEGLKGDLGAATLAFLRTMQALLDMSSELLADSAFLAALKDGSKACKTIADSVVASFANLLGALLPPIADVGAGCGAAATQLVRYEAPAAGACTAETAPSLAPNGAIRLGELCDALLRLVSQLHVAECRLAERPGDAQAATALAVTTTLRRALAKTARPVAADIARLQDEVARLADWEGKPAASCLEVPAEAARAVTSATAARTCVLREIDALTTTLTTAPSALRALRTFVDGLPDADALKSEFREEVSRAVDAAARAGLAATRFLRAATLIAVVLQGDEGSPAGAPGRRAKVVQLVALLKSMAAELPVDGKPQPDIAAAADALEKADAELTRLEKGSFDLAAAWRRALLASTDASSETIETKIKELERAADAMPGFLQDLRIALEDRIEAVATDLARKLIVGAGKTFEPLADGVALFLKPASDILTRALAAVVDARKAVLAQLQPGGARDSDPVLRSILAALSARLGGALLTVTCVGDDEIKQCAALPSDAKDAPKDRLALEASLAAKIERAITDKNYREAFDHVRKLSNTWRNGPALAVIVRQIASVDSEFARSLVLSAVDLKAVRRELESRIRDLVPARAVLPYDLDAELGPFPPDESSAIFVPEKGTRLTLRSRTTVHLLPPIKPPEFKVTGEVGPFAVKLIGPVFDVCTISFQGLSFEGGGGRSPDFRVRFKSVALGEKAKFLQPLQEFLSPKGGGFYLKFLEERPGIEAGYGINLGVIGVGALSFSNVVLNAAARLPFDSGPDADARFVVSIGRSDSPFLISSTIFGGGGYLALIANTRKIVGFEATFDYGGVIAFGFGPLQGIGRVTMGVYLRKENDKTSLGATFFAGGSAHIACFGFSTSLCVRLVQNDGGPMYGKATYTFSFSIGIDDIEFEVAVEKNAGATMGSQQDAALGPRDGGSGPALDAAPIRFAESGLQMNDALPPGALRLAQMAGAPRTPLGRIESLQVRGVRQRRETWKSYSQYFDDGLRPAGARKRARP